MQKCCRSWIVCVVDILLSSGMTLDHMPWLGDLVKYVPLAPGVVRMRVAARTRAAERFHKGATSKDLFYYLVSIMTMWSGQLAHSRTPEQ